MSMMNDIDALLTQIRERRMILQERRRVESEVHMTTTNNQDEGPDPHGYAEFLSVRAYVLGLGDAINAKERELVQLHVMHAQAVEQGIEALAQWPDRQSEFARLFLPTKIGRDVRDEAWWKTGTIR